MLFQQEAAIAAKKELSTKCQELQVFLHLQPTDWRESVSNQLFYFIICFTSYLSLLYLFNSILPATSLSNASQAQMKELQQQV